MTPKKRYKKLGSFFENNRIAILCIFLVVIFIIALLLRIFPIDIAHWWDETVYLQNSEVIFSGVDNYNEFSFRPPLLSIFIAASYLLWHSSIMATIVTSFLASLSVIFIFLIGYRMYDWRVGMVASFLSAFIPFFIGNSRAIMTDMPLVSLMAISFFFLLYDDSYICLFLCGAFLSLSILMKFTAILLPFVFLTYFLVRRFNLKQVGSVISGAGLFILPYFIWSQLVFSNFLHPIIKAASMVSSRNHSWTFYFANLPQAFTIFACLGLFVYLAFILIHWWRARNIDWHSQDWVLWSWIIIFLAYLIYTPHKELRYLLPISIPFLLLSSEGWSNFSNLFWKYSKKVAIVLGIILFLFGVYWASVNNTLAIRMDRSKTEEMKMSYYLSNHSYNQIYANHNWPVFAYYSGIETNVLMPYDKEFYDKYREIMKSGVIIVDNSTGKHPTVEWLNENTEFKFVKRYGSLFAYRFRPS